MDAVDRETISPECRPNAGWRLAMLTALTAGGLSFGSYQQTIQDNMLSRAATDLQTKQAKLTASYEAKSDAISRQSDRLINLTSNVKNAEVAIDNGLEGIEEIETLLNNMKAALGEIERSDSEYYRDQYDDYLRQINSVADRYSSAFNPIGRVTDRLTWEPNDIVYNKDYASTQTTLPGTYVGADFRIEDVNGTMWIPDLGSQTLTEYTSYNAETPRDSDETGQITSTINGITAVTEPDASGNQTFSMIIGGEEVQVTGKLVTGGLGVTGTWNHNDFATQDDIDAAVDELNAASVKLDIAKAQIVSNKTMVSTDLAGIDKKQDALKEDQRDAMYDNLEALTALEQEYNQQVTAMQRNMEAMSVQQQTYLSVFSSALSSSSNNPLFVDTMI
jgi:predicted  nucleic acid-binding Zn-ribbon protein